MEFPPDIIKLIKDFSQPVTHSLWREGSPIAWILKNAPELCVCEIETFGIPLKKYGRPCLLPGVNYEVIHYNVVELPQYNDDDSMFFHVNIGESTPNMAINYRIYPEKKVYMHLFNNTCIDIYN